MRRIRPALLVLTELELWPNLIAAAKKCGAKVAVVNGRLGERSYRGYRRFAWLVRGALAQLDLVAVQNAEYAHRFRELGAAESALHVTGSIKFDGARTRRDGDEIRRLAQLAGIGPRDMVFLAGSTQDPEEAIALDVFERLDAEFPRLKLVLVPRHPERFDDVAALLDRRGVNWQRRSQLVARHSVAGSRDPVAGSGRILLVDAVGELGHWWGTAQIAFVGGSLTQRGGQNMIEPAGYGAAISFGPNTWNFRDVVALFLERQAAAVVRNRPELESFVRRCLAEPAYADDLGRRAQELVLQQQGAADRTIDLLHQLAGATTSRLDAAHGLAASRKVAAGALGG
jgi:3-deoxy-D-manno-octulosonic-acid transferase